MSDENKLTYSMIQQRCKEAASELMPDFPKEGTLESWKSFLYDLNNLDLYYEIHESVESWDWTIYTHYGFKIVQLMDQQELIGAESQWLDLQGGVELDQSFGVYEMASQVAYQYLIAQVSDHVEVIRQDLIDLAEDQIENMEES